MGNFNWVPWGYKTEITITSRPYTQNGEVEPGGYVEKSKILISPTGLKWK